MRRNLAFYITAFALLLVTFWFFNKAFSELVRYAELSHRANSIYSGFQNLSRNLKNAAVLNPTLVNSKKDTSHSRLFYTDSTSIMEQLDLLKATVRDSVNIRIVSELEKRIVPEISWILASNVPDSIIHQKALGHISSLVQIDSLVNEGIHRTSFVLDYRKTELEKATRYMRTWMIAFIALSAALLFYTTLNYFRQQSKTRRKEHELETVLNRINDSVISIDNNWRYTFMNDAAMATHPLGRKGTIGKSLWAIHPELKGTLFGDMYMEAMRTKKLTTVENYYPPMDAWFSVKIYPSTNGLTIFFNDITETKKAEQQLANTLKELTDYKVALDESSIVAITDQKGIIKHANQNFCKISKYSLEELIGRDHRIINSGHHSKEFIRDIWVTIANGKIWKGELKNKAKDGTIYWVDTTIVPFLDKNGKPYQYVAIRADITERKNTEERLQASEKLYKTIASSIPGSMICLFDTEYRYLLVEGDLITKLGFTEKQLLGNKASEVLPPELFKDVKSMFDKVLQGETIIRESHRNDLDILSRYVPLKNEKQEVYAILTAAIDVTPLKNAQRELYDLNRSLEDKVVQRTAEVRKTNEELEAFSYSVSHDLRAPLRAIIGYANILEEDHGNKLGTEGKAVLDVIASSTLKMGRLIDDLLAFSRMGKKEIFKTRLDTRALIDEIIAGVIPSTNDTTICWDIHELPDMFADLNTIRQVWINLVSNAVKYSGKVKNPKIEINAYHEDAHTVFFVRDNGAGFDAQFKEKLFKVFQRLHDADEFEGTGVGLALVERIISKHGGKVWAEGKENEGACFYFSLPDQTI